MWTMRRGFFFTLLHQFYSGVAQWAQWHQADRHSQESSFGLMRSHGLAW